jgi:hypothetical protein
VATQLASVTKFKSLSHVDHRSMSELVERGLVHPVSPDNRLKDVLKRAIGLHGQKLVVTKTAQLYCLYKRRLGKEHGVTDFSGFYNPDFDTRGKHIMAVSPSRFEMFNAEAAYVELESLQTRATPHAGNYGAYTRMRGWKSQSAKVFRLSFENYVSATRPWSINIAAIGNVPSVDAHSLIQTWNPMPRHRDARSRGNSPAQNPDIDRNKHEETQLWKKFNRFEGDLQGSLSRAVEVSVRAWTHRWQGKKKARKSQLQYYEKLYWFGNSVSVLSPYRSPSFADFADAKLTELEELRVLYVPFVTPIDIYPFGGSPTERHVWREMVKDTLIPGLEFMDHRLDTDTDWASIRNYAKFLSKQGVNDHTSLSISSMEKFGFAGIREHHCSWTILVLKGQESLFDRDVLINMVEIPAGKLPCC